MKRRHDACCARMLLARKRAGKVIWHVPSVPSVLTMLRMLGDGLKESLMQTLNGQSRLASIMTAPFASGS